MTVGYTKDAAATTSGTSRTWSRACAVGDTLILEVQHSGNNTITVTDNSAGTNVWTKVAGTFEAGTPATSQRLLDVWMCTPTVAITSVTATGGASGAWVMQAVDYAGPRSLRGTGQKVNGGSFQTSPAIAVVAGDELIVCVAYNAPVAGTLDDTITLPSGWVNYGENNPTGITTQSTMWHLAAPSTASTAPRVTLGGGGSVGVVFLALQNTSNAAPTVGAMPAIYRTGSGNISLSGVINDDVQVTSAAWTLLTGPDTPTVSTATSGLNTTTCTATSTVAVTPGIYTFRLTGGDGALTGFGDVTAYVAAATAADVPVYSVSSSTGYTNTGGAANITAALNDALSTTYAETGAAPAATTITGFFCPYALGNIGFLLGGYSAPSSPSVTVQVTIYKEDATTQIYQTSFVLPTADADTPINLDSAALAAIPTVADRRKLAWKVSATQ